MLDISLRNLLAWALQVAALVTAGVLLPSLLRMTSPRARLLHLRALLIVCLALPVLQPWVPSQVAKQTPAASVELADRFGADGTLRMVPAIHAAAPVREEGLSAWLASRRWQFESMLLAVFVAGVTLRLAWLGVGLISLARLRRSAAPLDPRPESVEAAALLVGVSADFRVSPQVVRPVTFGLRKPLVLVPPGFAAFEGPQQTAVAAHELLHVARRDWLSILADEVLLSVLWFHPAIWWLVDEIRLSTEQVVDREVVRLVGARKPYLEALLKLAAAGPTPMLQPASPFLKHGHLAQRVALLVREVSMSRVRLVCSFVVVLAVLAAGGWFAVQAFPLRATSEPVVLPSMPAASGVAQVPLPSPPPPPPPPPAPAAEPKVQVAKPATPGDFDKTVAELTARAAREPNDPEIYYTLAVAYWDRAYNGADLGSAKRAAYAATGLTHVDKALQLKPDYVEALVYKNLLLRQKATLETDPAVQRALIAEADMIRDQAMKTRDAQNAWDAVPANALRVGNAITPPKKIKHVAPVYPPDAVKARITGVVIVEAVIGEDGKVRDTRVRRSIPKLDAAAVDAVRQWEFTPTTVNGVAVPVVMTMTVNFVTEGTAAAGKVVVAPPLPPPLPPPPPAEQAWHDPAAVKIGGAIVPPTKLVDARPVYPPDAKAAKIQGVVILEVLIGEDGKVEQARVLQSIPELDQAAIDAVRKWEFTRTLVNGEPKKFIMTVTINFKLQ